MSTSTLSTVLRISGIAAALIALAGCASGPAPAPSAGTAHSQAAAQAGAMSAKHLTKVQKLVAEARQAGLPDFYALVRSGHTTYCWRGKDIGTLIPSTKCVQSEAEVRQVLRALAEERHRMADRPQGMCGGTGNCAGN